MRFILFLMFNSPKFSAEAFISAMVRCGIRPRVDAVGGFELPAGECND